MRYLLKCPEQIKLCLLCCTKKFTIACWELHRLPAFLIQCTTYMRLSLPAMRHAKFLPCE